MSDQQDDPNDLYPPQYTILPKSSGLDFFGISKQEYEHWKGTSGPALVHAQMGGEVQQECKHEPIDVGFSRTKLVCKKCDKDL